MPIGVLLLRRQARAVDAVPGRTVPDLSPLVNPLRSANRRRTILHDEHTDWLDPTYFDGLLRAAIHVIPSRSFVPSGVCILVRVKVRWSAERKSVAGPLSR